MNRPLLVLAAILVVPAARAQTASAPGVPRHAEAPAEIVVTAPFARNRVDILQGVTVLQGIVLTRELRATIGETLARQPGVSSTAFGPNASRPVLRGFQGERIRVLTDGIGSFDVSNTSVDHAVVANPQLAERIEVLRGPASLLYGSSAVGGVVNIIDKRIPRTVPDEIVHTDLLGTYGSAASEASFNGLLDVPLGHGIVAHVDGSYQTTDDLRIGGHVLSRPLRAQALASEDPAVRALANLNHRLPNSNSTTIQYAGGAALIDSRGDLGVVVSRYDSTYGVPARYDIETGDGEQVHLAVKQTRVDARGALNFDGGFFERLNIRWGFADYQHQELGTRNEVNTTFLNKSFEGRFELAQRKHGNWRGATGVQLLVRDFDIVGAEAFVPKNATVQAGVFTLQEVDLGRIHAEVSGRYERTNLSTRFAEFRDEPNPFDRSYDAFSGTFGASYGLTDKIRLGVNVSRTERAPAAEEALANGPHAGTQAFEIGDRRFTTEKAFGVEAVLRGRSDRLTFEASVYYNRFSDYIYEDQTGEIEDGLPVFQFRQGSARYYGAEAQVTATVAKFGDWTLGVDALADYVRADLLGGLGPVPRIPPLRVLGGVDVGSKRISGRFEAEWADSQTRVSAIETPTASYTLLNASLSFRPELLARLNTSLILSANNLADVDARRHASFLKDFAPLPGRDIRVSLRVVY